MARTKKIPPPPQVVYSSRRTKKSWVVIPTTKTLVCTSRLMKLKTMCTEEEALPWADRLPASSEEVKLLNQQLECGRRIRIRKARIGQNLLERLLQWGLTMSSVTDCFSSLKRVSRAFNKQVRLCKYPCMACQFKDMVCAVHVVMNHGIIMQPSPFDPPLKIYGSRKFDGHYSSDSSEELFSGSEEDVYRFQPVDSTRLPHKKMLRYPQAKTKKHASKGICPRYVKGKCNRRGYCPFSHSLVGVKAEKDKQRYQTRRNGQR